jgi:mono/diheme cytochrome c family protein
MVFEGETGRMMSKNSAQSSNGLRTSLLIATICLIGTAYWVFASGDNLPGKPKLADKPASIENSMDFAVIYAKNCAACHGADGKLGPAPPLNDPLFRAIMPADALTQVISEGRTGTPMPGFARAHSGTLARPQIQVLVDQIKGVPEANGGAAVWGSIEPAPSDAPPYLGADHQAERTSVDFETIRTTLFAQACADCHGPHGEGTKSIGSINNPDFLALASDQLLRRIIITGRRDLGMPNYKSAEHRSSGFKPLTSADVDDLVALLAQWRQGKTTNAK